MEQTTILEELDQEGYVVIPIRGISMRPLLREDSSHVLIRRLDGKPKKNDVVLYVRPDGTQVLHRLMGYDGDVCLIRGDNTFGMERVPLSSVKGVMETFWRDNREINTKAGAQKGLYRLYVWFWNLIYPMRLLKHKGKAGINKVGRLLLGDTSLGWIVRQVRGSLAGILFLTLCTCVNAFLSVMLALVMRETIDYAVALNQPLFLRWSGIFLGIIIVQLAIRAVIRQKDENIRASIENKLKRHTYENILRSTFSGVKTFHTGELQNRMTNDVKIVADYVTDLLPGACSMAVQLVCALIILMVLDWRFGCIFLIGGIVMLCVTFLFRKKMKSLHKEVQEADGKMRSWLQESVESLLILKSFQAEGMASERTAEKTAAHKKARMKRRTFSNICNIGFGAVMQGSYLFGLVWCGFGILNGSLTYGTLTAVLQLINQIRSPFANISGFVPQYYAMLASAERLMELEKLPKDSAVVKEVSENSAEGDVLAKDNVLKSAPGGVSLGDNVLKPPLDGAPAGGSNLIKINQNRKRENLPEFAGLHARNLTFIYDDGEEEVLSDVSFDIKKGEIVALTGISGIGKSTLLKVLLGIYSPVSGQLYAECDTPAAGTGDQSAQAADSGNSQTPAADAGNRRNPAADSENPTDSRRPVRLEINAATRNWFSYVPQGNMLMSGSIYEAVDFLHSSPFTRDKKSKVEQACKIACADEFIRELPDGYNTVLGEKGAGLSEGQMQRIAIARAIYRNTPVLLLDEATSALDEDTEHRLLENLKEMGGQTVLIVTHRPAAMEICSKRLVFENSRIKEEKYMLAHGLPQMYNVDITEPPE